VQKELDKARRAGQTDAERAVAEARDAGAAESDAKWGPRLAAAELRAACAARGIDPAPILELGLDLAKFVGEDGEVKAKEIGQAVDKLAGLVAAGHNGGQPPPGRFPAGPRQPGAEPDFWRSVMPRQGR
jgi:hypothetical protein